MNTIQEIRDALKILENRLDDMEKGEDVPTQPLFAEAFIYVRQQMGSRWNEEVSDHYHGVQKSTLSLLPGTERKAETFIEGCLRLVNAFLFWHDRLPDMQDLSNAIDELENLGRDWTDSRETFWHTQEVKRMGFWNSREYLTPMKAESEGALYTTTTAFKPTQTLLSGFRSAAEVWGTDYSNHLGICQVH